jgi:peptidoglycan/xylan/chitin deacetylase (PgdA/CDA1 family)
MVRFVKILVEAVLIGAGMMIYHSGLASRLIRLNGRRVRVLMYHACEQEEGDFIRGLSINTRPARFAAQLDFLQRHYQIIPVEALGREEIPDRAVAITFDDGFRSVYQNAMPLLAARKIPATCYLVTDRLAGCSPIWINELNWFFSRHRGAAKALVARRLGISRLCSMPVFIRRVIDRYEPSVIGGVLADLRSALGPPEHSERLHLDHDEIEEMARCGFRFGNHTATHPVLSRLNERASREEIARGRDALAGLPGAIDSLAYPFGRAADATPRIARELDYTILMGVEGDNDPLELAHVGRVNVGSDSPAVLFARMELVARLKPRIQRLGRRIFPRTDR